MCICGLWLPCTTLGYTCILIDVVVSKFSLFIVILFSNLFFSFFLFIILFTIWFQPPVCEVGRKPVRHWEKEVRFRSPWVKGWAPHGCSTQQHTDQRQIYHTVWKCRHSPMLAQLRCASVRGKLLQCYGGIRWKLRGLSSTPQQSWREEETKRIKKNYYSFYCNSYNPIICTLPCTPLYYCFYTVLYLACV